MTMTTPYGALQTDCEINEHLNPAPKEPLIGLLLRLSERIVMAYVIRGSEHVVGSGLPPCFIESFFFFSNSLFCAVRWFTKPAKIQPRPHIIVLLFWNVDGRFFHLWQPDGLVRQG